MDGGNGGLHHERFGVGTLADRRCRLNSGDDCSVSQIANNFAPVGMIESHCWPSCELHTAKRGGTGRKMG